MVDMSLKGLETLKDGIKIKLASIKNKNSDSNVTDINDIRKKHNKNIEKPFSWIKNKKNISQTTIVWGIIALILVLLIVWGLVHKNAYEIYIGETSIGVIKEKGLEQDIYSTAKAQIESAEGMKIQLDSGYDIKSEFVHASKKEIVTTDHIISEIKNKLSYKVQAKSISIGGVEIGTLARETDINSVKEKILNNYTLEDVEIIDKGFVEEITIADKFVDKGETIKIDDLYNKLTAKSDVAKTYEVKQGDTLWVIANNNDLTLTQMLKINPGITENSILKIGQKLNLVVSKPILSVKMVTQVKYPEVIQCSVIYETDDSQFKTYKQVKQEGKDGKKEVTAQVTYINGYEEESSVVGETIIEEPIPNIIVTGTKALPAKSATGSFRRPLSGGGISSYFGARWGSYHNALDITSPKGTTIYASDGGTVKTAGWNGSFGNLIVIEHGNGFETYYAHCSRLDVKVGQKVAKGEKIATVGSTGNATGNHVHFEIRKNGTPVNPLNYIK